MEEPCSDADIGILASVPPSVGVYQFRKLEVLSDVEYMNTHIHTDADVHIYACSCIHSSLQTHVRSGKHPHHWRAVRVFCALLQGTIIKELLDCKNLGVPDLLL